MAADCKWLVTHADSSYDLRVSIFRRCTMMATSDFVASKPHSRDYWLVRSIWSAIYAGILYFILYGPVSVASELTMSRVSPQSISPQRGGSRHNRPESDANIRNFAPVARIMKTALPENAKIAKEAKECMQECVSEFISFITSEGMHAMVVPATTPATTLCQHSHCSSLRKMPTRKTEDGERRGYSVRHDLIRFRELC